MDSISVPGEDRPLFVSTGKDATAHHFETSNGLHVVLCFNDLSKFSDIEVIGLLLHECVHIWQAIVEWMREESPGDEVEAYSIQSIFVNMFSELKRKVKHDSKASATNHPLP